MFYEICTALALIVFIFIGYYVVQTLRTAQITLHNINHCTRELERKAQHLESTFKTIDNLGEICEKETLEIRKNYLDKKCSCQGPDYKEDLTNWIITSLKLGSKLLRRK